MTNAPSRASILRAQSCKACGTAGGFDFHVPDEVWAAVVPRHLRKRVVCLRCFDRFALERGIDYAPHLRQIYFAGDAAVFRFEVIECAGGGEHEAPS